MISKLPNGHIEVKARRRLKDSGTFEAFVEELQSVLISAKESNSDATVADFDVSQNPITADQFEMIFNALALAGVKVQRYRLFGCPALNDEAMRHLAEHFTQDLTSETSPAELHLSDCAIMTDGFLALMSAIEEKELYPTQILRGRALPLYLRLENNYIDEAVIQEKVDAGIIRGYKKGPGVRQEAGPSVKINLVVRLDNSYQQKTGEPPAPEDAPPPKPVHDGAKSGWQDNRSTNWQQGSGRPAWSQTAWQPRSALPALIRPQQWSAPARPFTQGNARTATVRPQSQWGNQGSWGRGSAAAATDRSRTPAGRGANSGPYPPSGPPPKKSAGLPHPWEEQWSDEYQIPYYWNSETGEALWEKPTA